MFSLNSLTSLSITLIGVEIWYPITFLITLYCRLKLQIKSVTLVFHEKNWYPYSTELLKTYRRWKEALSTSLTWLWQCWWSFCPYWLSIFRCCLLLSLLSRMTPRKRCELTLEIATLSMFNSEVILINNYWIVSDRQELLWQNVLENLVFDFLRK